VTPGFALVSGRMAAMMRGMKRFAWTGPGLALAWIGAIAAAPAPRPEAHAHNDYEHARPLTDALAEGFCSVEADVWLVDGELRVAHDLEKTVPGRTLQSLYLEPLRERVAANGGGVHAGGPALTLLVDIKSDADATYRVLRGVLADYRAMLTRFTPESTTPGAVTVILSGNRPLAAVAAEAERWCAIDGRLADLTAAPAPSVHLMPLVSQGWTAVFRPFENGALAEADRARLREWVELAHRQGRRIRFWGYDDRPYAWRALREAGVDLINTDDLAGLSEFLASP